MEEKAEGFEGGVGGAGGVEREMLQLWGDKTTVQHLTCGCVGGREAEVGGPTGLHTVALLHWGWGGGVAGMQLISFGEMDHSLEH